MRLFQHLFLGLMFCPTLALATDNVAFFFCHFNKVGGSWGLADVTAPEKVTHLDNGQTGHVAEWTNNQVVNTGECALTRGTDSDKLGSAIVIVQGTIVSGFSADCAPSGTSVKTVASNSLDLSRGEFNEVLASDPATGEISDRYRLYYPRLSEMNGDISGAANAYCASVNPTWPALRGYTSAISQGPYTISVTRYGK